MCTPMNCTLMHKNMTVVDIAIDPDNGYIDKIGVLHNPEHLPIVKKSVHR